MVSYNNLWKSLIDKGMKKTDLIKEAGISSATLAKMSNNQLVSMETIIKICDVMGCEISDVVTIDHLKESEK